MTFRYKFSAAVTFLFIISGSAHAEVNAKVDTNGDGFVSSEEFVMFNAEKDFRQRDQNKDDVLTTKEWVGNGSGTFRKASMKRFDADNNGEMTPSEVVEVYLWAFNNRDKNKDDKLTGSEIPKSMLVKTKK